ncbi:hypothetical protein BOTBODRAFT_36311 [Botryobasidium botryosum FD-172 SS1]|uniref:Uncharacterized protein n=1 Tax=Botryobasidium botryosum (strain FD-172 SS1) TaxID=930990 RepID=A0A067MEY1_BOTB1|nr:hypothetical protein BOTBODRAFT_36311 [Botryobasidium botryosum FD-172 SS1]
MMHEQSFSQVVRILWLISYTAEGIALSQQHTARHRILSHKAVLCKGTRSFCLWLPEASMRSPAPGDSHGYNTCVLFPCSPKPHHIIFDSYLCYEPHHRTSKGVERMPFSSLHTDRSLATYISRPLSRSFTRRHYAGVVPLARTTIPSLY